MTLPQKSTGEHLRMSISNRAITAKLDPTHWLRCQEDTLKQLPTRDPHFENLPTHQALSTPRATKIQRLTSSQKNTPHSSFNCLMISPQDCDAGLLKPQRTARTRECPGNESTPSAVSLSSFHLTPNSCNHSPQPTPPLPRRSPLPPGDLQKQIDRLDSVREANLAPRRTAPRLSKASNASQ